MVFSSFGGDENIWCIGENILKELLKLPLAPSFSAELDCISGDTDDTTLLPNEEAYLKESLLLVVAPILVIVITLGTIVDIVLVLG